MARNHHYAMFISHIDVDTRCPARPFLAISSYCGIRCSSHRLPLLQSQPALVSSVLAVFLATRRLCLNI